MKKIVKESYTNLTSRNGSTVSQNEHVNDARHDAASCHGVAVAMRHIPTTHDGFFSGTLRE